MLRRSFLRARRALSLAILVSAAGTGCSGGATAGPPALPLPDRFALQFDGINDYASAGTAGFPKVMQAQTLSLWVNVLAGNDPQTFIVLRRFLDNGLQLGVSGGKLSAWRTSDGASLVDGPLMPEGAWHHVAYVYDGTSQHTLFLDGVQVAKSATTAPDPRVNIGVWLGSLDGGQEMFSGQLDGVHVWNVARSAADLAAEMAGDLPAPQSALVAWWGFDEDGGYLAYDYSGHGNTCTLGDGDAMRAPIRVPTTIRQAADAGQD